MKRRWRFTAFSIPELLLGMVLLGLLTGILFQILLMGVGNWQLGHARSSGAIELRRICQALRNDLRHSSYYSVSFVNGLNVTVNIPGVASQQVNRDALCMAALKLPNDPASYDSDQYSLPKWDCYCAYYTSQDLPSGTMLRYITPRTGVSAQMVAGLGDTYAEPLATFVKGSNLLSMSPPIVLGAGFKTISKSIHSITYELIPGEQAVKVRLVILDDINRVAGAGKSTAEFLESTFSMQCNNTWPPL